MAARFLMREQYFLIRSNHVKIYHGSASLRKQTNKVGLLGECFRNIFKNPKKHSLLEYPKIFREKYSRLILKRKKNCNALSMILFSF